MVPSGFRSWQTCSDRRAVSILFESVGLGPVHSIVVLR